MTPEQIEIHRQRFERLCDGDFIGKSPSGIYHWNFIQERWQGYLLCAENMPEVHLPLSADEWGQFDRGYNQALEDLKHRLESQGYTVKTL